MSSWRRAPIVLKPVRRAYDTEPFINPYERYRSLLQLIDKRPLFPLRAAVTRMFNCALLVHDISGNFKFTIDSPEDQVFLMYRVNPLETVSNTISVGRLDLSTLRVSFKENIVVNEPRGDFEDARFFIDGDSLGISYTYHGSVSTSLINREFTPIAHDYIPIYKHFPAPEKNWVFFSKDATLYAIRNYCPLEMYMVDAATKALTPLPIHRWRHPIPGLVLRGGTPPVLVNGMYYMLLHSASTYRMYMLVLDAETFLPKYVSAKDLLNIPTTFQFPCGMVYDVARATWIISLGVDDLYCGVVEFKHSEILRELIAIKYNNLHSREDCA